jgi:hypothetical protein
MGARYRVAVVRRKCGQPSSPDKDKDKRTCTQFLMAALASESHSSWVFHRHSHSSILPLPSASTGSLQPVKVMCQICPQFPQKR